MPTFWTLRPQFSVAFATLGKLDNVPDHVSLSKLRRGHLIELSLDGSYFARDTTAYQFGPSGKKTPAGSEPVDLYRNRQGGCLVVSTRLGAALASADPTVRLATVKIKGVKSVNTAVVVTAPLVDALDAPASGARFEKWDGAPDEIIAARRLVINPANVPEQRTVFRTPHLSTVWFIRDALKPALASFVGLAIEDPATVAID